MNSNHAAPTLIPLLLIAVALFGLTLMAPALAAAGTPRDANSLTAADIGLDDSAQLVSDRQMDAMRGRFVIAGGQQILYFGLVMQSQMQDAAGNTVAAGVGFGLSLKPGRSPMLTEQTWTSQSSGVSGGVDGLSGGNALPGLGGGVGQVIQITGLGNHGTNQASIDITTLPQHALMADALPNGAPCTQLCQATIKSNAVEVLVGLPGQGHASQSLGASSIQQDIRLGGAMTQAANSMNLTLQVGPAAAFDTLGLSTILQSSIPPRL